MRILLFNNKYLRHAGGGAQVSVRLLAKDLAARGHEVVVGATAYRSTRDVMQENDHGVHVVYLPVRNIYWQHGTKRAALKPLWHLIDSANWLMHQPLLALLRQWRPDVVHTNVVAGLSPVVWAAAADARVPVVHTLRDYYLLCPNGRMLGAAGPCDDPCTTCRLYSLPKRRLARHVDHVVGISDYILRRHQAAGMFSGVRSEVIPNAHGLTIEAGEDVTAAKILTLGYLGRLSPEKGVQPLIEAFGQATARGLAARLLVAGEGDPAYRQTLAARANSNVEFLGAQDTAHFLRQLDVLVVPSMWHEPFGRVVVEAFAAGVPVLVSRRGALPELVQEGRTGWIYDPDCPGALAAALMNLDRTSALSRRAASLAAAEQYTVRQITDRYLHAYERVIHPRPVAQREEDAEQKPCYT